MRRYKINSLLADINHEIDIMMDAFVFHGPCIKNIRIILYTQTFIVLCFSLKYLIKYYNYNIFFLGFVVAKDKVAISLAPCSTYIIILLIYYPYIVKCFIRNAHEKQKTIIIYNRQEETEKRFIWQQKNKINRPCFIRNENLFSVGSEMHNTQQYASLYRVIFCSVNNIYSFGHLMRSGYFYQPVMHLRKC